MPLPPEAEATVPQIMPQPQIAGAQLAQQSFPPVQPHETAVAAVHSAAPVYEGQQVAHVAPQAAMPPQSAQQPQQAVQQPPAPVYEQPPAPQYQQP